MRSGPCIRSFRLTVQQRTALEGWCRENHVYVSAAIRHGLQLLTGLDFTVVPHDVLNPGLRDGRAAENLERIAPLNNAGFVSRETVRSRFQETSAPEQDRETRVEPPKKTRMKDARRAVPWKLDDTIE